MEDHSEATGVDDVEPADRDDAQDAEVAPAAAAEPEIPAVPAPSAPAPTGVGSVDAALERLKDVESAPLDDHVEIFDDVQRQLHDALAELDDEQ